MNDSEFESKHNRDELGRFTAKETVKQVNQAELTNIKQSILYKKLTKELQRAIDFIYTSKPVVYLTGYEFQKDNIPLTEKVPDYYFKNYPNGVNNPILGNVKLDREGVKDSLAHGMGSLKAAAYKAVPEVIQQGYIYNQEKNWKNRGYDTSVIIAPIKIKDDVFICEVVVEKRPNRQGFYLHEVEITKKFADVFKTPTEGSTSAKSKLIITQKILKLNFKS